ncbi:hypothetical protein [Adhaeribacter soli]|uniref:Uncharacterized protein n=1 Tax=Adhaeribacter soli TaxID=2607655 RepID=A0A5N1IXZ3_9BACT|nr:hypothetical protein [Adhaeribacter soli]KAA9338978.1 hypothetical protein F0P94_09310 [Adhaeribacter soli]
MPASLLSNPTEITNHINNQLQTRTALQAAIVAAQNSINQKQEELKLSDSALFILQNDRNIQQASSINKLVADLFFNLDQGINLFYSQGLLGQPEYDEYSRFKDHFQDRLNVLLDKRKGLNKLRVDSINGFTSDLQALLSESLEWLQMYYKNFGPNWGDEVNDYFSKIIYAWSVLRLESITLPGYNNCSFLPVFYTVSSSKDLLLQFRSFLIQQAGLFDPSEHDDLLRELDNLENETDSIAQRLSSISELTPDIINEFKEPIHRWINQISELIQRSIDRNQGNDAVTNPLYHFHGIFSRLDSYLQIIRTEGFPPIQAGEYLEFSHRTFELILQRYIGRFEYLLSQLEANEMELEDQARLRVQYFLTSKLPVLNEILSRLSKDFYHDQLRVPASFFETFQHIEAEFNEFFIEQQLVSANNQQLRLFMFAGAEGVWTSLSQYFTTFLDVPSGATMAELQVLLNEESHQEPAQIVLQNRQDLSRYRSLIEQGLDLMVNLNQGINLFYSQGTLSQQEYDEYDGFRQTYQPELDRLFIQVNSLSELDREQVLRFSEGLKSLFNGIIGWINEFYDKYSPSWDPEFAGFFTKIHYACRVVQADSYTLPGCRNCSFVPVFYTVAASKDILKQLRAFIISQEHAFDPHEFNDLLSFLTDSEKKRTDIEERIAQAFSENRDSNEIKEEFHGWVNQLLEIINKTIEVNWGKDPITEPLKQLGEIFSGLNKYLEIIRSDSFPPTNAEEYRQFSFMTFELILQHYISQFENLLPLVEENGMDLEEQAQLRLHYFLTNKLIVLKETLERLKADFSNGQPWVPASYIETVQQIEAELNSFFTEQQIRNAEHQRSPAFLFTGIVGSRISLFQYFTLLLDAPSSEFEVLVMSLTADIAALEYQITSYQNQINEINKDLESFPQYTIGSFKDLLPVLLMPVRIETKFVNLGDDRDREDRYKLRVRIYPDQISVDNHEEALTENEILAGKAYWEDSISIYLAERSTDSNFHRLAAWRGLLSMYTANRAAWIVRMTQPVNLEEFRIYSTNQEYSGSGTPKDIDLPTLQFSEVNQKSGAWTQAALASALPEQFVVSLYKKDYSLTEPGVPKDIFSMYLDGKSMQSAENPAAPPYVPGPTAELEFRDNIKNLTTEFLKLSKQVIGRPVKPDLQVGLDPQRMLNPEESASDFEEVLDEHESPVGKLTMDPNLKWMTDFEEAMEVGMGIEVPITPAEWEEGAEFSRLVVLGIRSKETSEQGAASLHNLLENHVYTDGLRLIPQGTPTNNTDNLDSGFSVSDNRNPEETFKIFLGEPLFTRAENELLKSDGQRLSEVLGLSPSLFQHARFSNSKDISEAKVMNASLWPATLGYFMEEMMRPVFSSDAIDNTREFFNRYVQGRGFVPAFGVGSLPYGIMPTTRYSAWQNKNREDAFQERLLATFKKLNTVWTERLNQVVRYPAFAYLEGKHNPAGLEGTNLLSIMGKEATSGLFEHRYIIGTDYYVYLKKLGPLITQYTGLDYNIRYGDILMTDPIFKDSNGKLIVNPRLEKFEKFSPGLFDEKTITDLGLTPRIFDFIFQEGYNQLMRSFSDDPLAELSTGILIDDAPLSEKLSLSKVYDNTNYIHWLSDIHNNFDNIRREIFNGEINEKTQPKALLYYMLRQGLMLQYWDTATKMDSSKRMQEIEFFNMGTKPDLSRWDLLYDKGASGQMIYEELEEAAKQPSHPDLNISRFAAYREQMGLLSELPTARLERLFAEHLDLCSYRLDAWQAGLVQQRLEENRQEKAEGIYLGAFAWLENITRFGDNRDNSAQIDTEENLWEDPDNMGFIHAPSITQATAAAVLRHAYKSRQFYSFMPYGNRMAVNLSSERTRKALKIMEGIKAGQSLSALLGYQFERALHDAYVPNVSLSSLDQYIAWFRSKFPLSNDKNSLVEPDQNVTPEEEAFAQEVISARDVTDGLQLVEKYFKSKKQASYGIDFTGIDTSDRPTIIKEIEKLADTVDAISDLVTAESIYQSVQGNYDAVNASMESIAKGKFPVSPEVINTPRTGTSLTHKVIVQLPQPGSTSATTDPWQGFNINATPLSNAEPALNSWLAGLIGPPDLVKLNINYETTREENPQMHGTLSWTLVELGLQPLNLLHLLDERALEPGSSFDNFVRLTVEAELMDKQIYKDASLLPGDILTLGYDYSIRPEDGKSLAEMVTLFSKVRSLLNGSRPVNALDLVRNENQNLSGPNPEGYIFGNLSTRAEQVKTGLNSLTTRLEAELNSTASPRVEVVFGLLKEAASYNIQEAIIASSFKTLEEILPIAKVVFTIISKRIANATIALNKGNSLEAFDEAFKAMLGGSFKVVPLYEGTTENDEQLISGLENSSQMLPSNLLATAVMEEWLQGLAVVRDKMDALEKVMMMDTMLRISEDEFGPEALMKLTPVQLPVRIVNGSYQDKWVGIEFGDSYVPEGDKLSLVMLSPDNFQAHNPNSGLVIDEWSEIIPNREETTSVAFHYDQPNNEAPQSLLLAVSPTLGENGGAWKWEDLLGAVNESLDMAKKRLVDIDHLSFTHLSPFLPAIVAPVSQFATTISLDYRRSTTQTHYPETLLAPTPR